MCLYDYREKTTRYRNEQVFFSLFHQWHLNKLCLLKFPKKRLSPSINHRNISVNILLIVSQRGHLGYLCDNNNKKNHGTRALSVQPNQNYQRNRRSPCICPIYDVRPQRNLRNATCTHTIRHPRQTEEGISIQWRKNIRSIFIVLARRTLHAKVSSCEIKSTLHTLPRCAYNGVCAQFRIICTWAYARARDCARLGAYMVIWRRRRVVPPIMSALRLPHGSPMVAYSRAIAGRVATARWQSYDYCAWATHMMRSRTRITRYNMCVVLLSTHILYAHHTPYTIPVSRAPHIKCSHTQHAATHIYANNHAQHSILGNARARSQSFNNFGIESCYEDAGVVCVDTKGCLGHP